MPFSLRVRLGRCEVEISGSRDEVLKTVEDLPNLVATISEAFAKAGVEVSEEPMVEQTSSLPSSAPVSVAYPSIQSSGNCSDAVLKLLSSDWGRATPRTLPELIEAMKANAVHYPATTLSGVLNWLVRKGRVKRWKTDKGYVYVLSGPNIGPGQLQTQVQSETNVSVASSGGS
jgi:predicted transcriptional regulator